MSDFNKEVGPWDQSFEIDQYNQIETSYTSRLNEMAQTFHRKIPKV